MGKRSNFKRMKNDVYDTPLEAVIPLITALSDDGFSASFIEPCAGNMTLVKHLADFGHSCIYAGDIEPRDGDVEVIDATTHRFSDHQLHAADCFITNPPWTREILHPMIVNLSDQLPTLLLFDADWMHTKQSAELMAERCKAIISVGRVKWIPGSKMTGKDNCCWYSFDHPDHKKNDTEFIGRQV